MKAKFRCQSVTNDGATESVAFVPTYNTDDQKSNLEWSSGAPAGSVFLSISNTKAWGTYKPMADYWFDVSSG